MNQHIENTAAILRRALQHRAVLLEAMEERRPKAAHQVLSEDLLAVSRVIRGVTREGLIEIAGEEAFQ
jgi:hypothetical protein